MLPSVIPKINSVVPPHTVRSSVWVVVSCWSVVVFGVFFLVGFFEPYKDLALFFLVLMCIFFLISVKRVEQEQKKVFFSHLSLHPPSEVFKSLRDMSSPHKERLWVKMYLKESFPDVFSASR